MTQEADMFKKLWNKVTSVMTSIKDRIIDWMSRKPLETMVVGGVVSYGVTLPLLVTGLVSPWVILAPALGLAAWGLWRMWSAPAFVLPPIPTHTPAETLREAELSADTKSWLAEADGLFDEVIREYQEWPDKQS